MMDNVNTHLLTRKINWHHAAIQGAYWASNDAIWGFIAVVLLSLGFANTQVGIITSLAALLPILTSPRLSALADKNNRFTARRLALLLTLLMELAAILLLCSLGHSVIVTVCFLVIGWCLTSTPPFFNVMFNDFSLRGLDVNYGLGRGIGSVFYAAVSLLVGLAMAHRAPTLVIPLFLVLNALTAIAVATFRYPLPPLPPQKAGDQPVSNRELLKKYPTFFLLILGWGLLFGSHNTSGTYLIHVIRKMGEGESLLGILIAVSVLMEFPSMWAFRSLLQKKSLRFWFCVSASAYVLRHIVLLVARRPLFLFLIAIIQFFETGMLVPATALYVVRYLDAANQAKGQTLMYTLSNGVIPACILFLSGRLVDVSGIDSALFLILACSMIGAAIVFAVLLLPMKKGDKTP